MKITPKNTPEIIAKYQWIKCENCVAYKHNTCPEIAAFVNMFLEFSNEEKPDFIKMTPDEYTQYFVKMVDDYDEYHGMYPALVEKVKHFLVEL